MVNLTHTLAQLLVQKLLPRHRCLRFLFFVSLLSFEKLQGGLTVLVSPYHRVDPIRVDFGNGGHGRAASHVWELGPIGNPGHRQVILRALMIIAFIYYILVQISTACL